MLFSGTTAVPSSACLRCQLRCVLQHLRAAPSTARPRYPANRSFSTAYSRRHAQESSKEPHEKKSNGVYYKHLSPGGRIVGKHGRKQRQVSEALATASLGERSEIVIFRDVMDTRPKKVASPSDSQNLESGEAVLKGLSLTAEQIQAAMSETEQAPDEEEVNTSIDSLRPQAPVLEQNEFDRLVKDLLESYNMRQLSRYLRRSLVSHKSSMTVVRQLQYKSEHSPAQGTRTISFVRSRWQPGRTPLEKRRISDVPAPVGASTTPKARVVERIVRAAWKVTTKTEETQMGELEVRMYPWALALFFDLTAAGKPKYHSLIEPPMLLRNSQIRPYRPDGILRITARRHDAEEIATQLENKVLLMGKMQLDLTTLIPKENSNAVAGRPLQMFRKNDLQEISQKTQSIFIQQRDGKIGIFSFKKGDRANARRLLLSLMDFFSRNVRAMSLDGSQMPQSTATGPVALIPMFPNRGVHFRDRSKAFFRTTTQVLRKTPETVSQPLPPIGDWAEGLARAIAPMTQDSDRHIIEEPAQLDQTKEPRMHKSYWTGRPFTSSSGWSVKLGLLMKEAKRPTTGDLLTQDKVTADQVSRNSTANSVLLREVPGHEALLSYLIPLERPPHQIGQAPSAERSQPDAVARKSTIVAHFTPSPFDKRGPQALNLFPRLELTLLRSYLGNDDADFKPDHLRGVLEEHIVNVPLPDKVVDLRLSRKVSAQAFMPCALADGQIRKFVSAFNQSVKSKGSLNATTEVTFMMPGWMASSDTATRQAQDESLPEIPVTYLFDHFEQIQSTQFRKNHDALKDRAKHNERIKLFKDHFEGCSLRYREIEAGDIGGRHTDISFKLIPASKRHRADSGQKTPTLDESATHESASALKALLGPALATADFLTRVQKGEITSWRGLSGLSREPKPVEIAKPDAEDQETVASDEVTGSSDEATKTDTEVAEVATEATITANEEAQADEDVAQVEIEAPMAVDQEIQANMEDADEESADRDTTAQTTEGR